MKSQFLIVPRIGRMTASIIGTRIAVACLLGTSVAGGDVMIGGDRPAILHVPSTYNPEIPAPFVLLLHGCPSQGNEEIITTSGFAPVAERLGLLYAAPDGLGPPGALTWFGCNASFAQENSRYLRSLIDEVHENFNVDQDRIFVSGLSDGGLMSYRMGCDHGDVIAAFASVLGANRSNCRPSTPVHALEVHGTEDVNVQYSEAVRSIEEWASEMSCDAQPDQIDRVLDLLAGADLDTSITRWSESCRQGGSAELWTMHGATHFPLFRSSSDSTALAVTQSFTDWLVHHPKRTTPEAFFTLSSTRGALPFVVAADGAGSIAPAGSSIATYDWSFGDGQTGSGVQVEHTYSIPGRHILSLTAITDDSRVSLKAREAVTVTCPSDDVTPWTVTDLGEPTFTASARRHGAEPDGVIVCAGGRAIAGTADQFGFVHSEVMGDVALLARVSELVNGGASSSVGVMLRGELADDAPFAMMGLERSRESYRLVFSYRTVTGGTVRRVRSRVASDTPNVWLRIERRGVSYSGLSSPDRKTWSILHEQEVTGIPLRAHGGLAAVGGDDGRLSRGFIPLEARISKLLVEPTLHRGDCNDDGTVDVSDAVCILNWLFLGTTAPGCVAATNTNGDAGADITDATYLLDHLFLGGPPPVAPYPECGPGTLPSDAETCEALPKICQPDAPSGGTASSGLRGVGRGQRVRSKSRVPVDRWHGARLVH